MARSNEYLNNSVMTRAAAKRKLRLILGGILSVFFAMSVVLALGNYNQAIHDGLIIYILCLLPSLYLLWTGIRAGREIELARRYHSIFTCDRDGVVTMNELSQQAGKPSGTVLRELETLFRRGYFVGCTLQREGTPAVHLSDAGAESEGFVTVACPHCGGSNRLRRGTAGRCEYCGGSVKG